MRLRLVLILAAFILRAADKASRQPRVRQGRPAPLARLVPLVRLAPLVRPVLLLSLVPLPAPTGRRSRLSQGPVINRPVAQVASRMRKFSMPTRSIPEERSLL